MRELVRHRATRLAVGLPAVLASWALLVGIPLAANPPVRGHLVARTIALTGPGATVRPTAAPPDRSVRQPGVATRQQSDRAANAGWAATVPIESGTQTVALTWSGAPTGSVQVRSKTAGRWSPWVTESSDPSEAPDSGGNGRAGIGPIWLGHAGVAEVQVRVARGSLTDLALDAMRWEPPSGGGTATAGAAPAEPAIHRPSEWSSGGWRSENPGCASAPVVMDTMRFAVVHHTVNSNLYQPGDVPGLMASIYRYHTESRGWCDTAYNFIIDRFGRTWQGRSGDVAKPIMGGHAKGFNTSSVGVSFLGQYEPGASPAATQPSQASLDAARDLIAWKFSIHGIDPTANILVESGGSTKYAAGVQVTLPTIAAHRDVGLTACPGQYVYNQLPAMRLRVKELLRASGSAWEPFPSSSALVGQQFADVLRRTASAAELTWWANRLENRTWNVGQFIATLVQSGEAERKVNSVIRLYFAFFQRPPDHSGITYWLGQRDRGRTLSGIAEQFASSNEFRSRYGHLSDTEYIGRVYANVLGRAPDRSGLTFWLARLAAGIPRGQMMASFSESSEYLVRSGGSVLLAASYEAMLRRAVDSGAFRYYGSRLATGTLLSTIEAALFSSAEYNRRF